MKLLKILGIAIGCLFGAVATFGIYTARQAGYYQSVVGSGLDHQLGFTHGSPYITAGGDSFEVFTLHPKPDGVLAAAGVRDGDIVLSHSITGFYRAIHEHRGSTITFRVADGDGVRSQSGRFAALLCTCPLNIKANDPEPVHSTEQPRLRSSSDE